MPVAWPTPTDVSIIGITRSPYSAYRFNVN